MEKLNKKDKTMNKLATKLNSNKTITFWSVYLQRWIKNASDIADRELAAMSEPERARVINHLSK